MAATHAQPTAGATGQPAAPGFWTLRAGLDLALDRPRVMGILNVTPDSFSDGGAFDDPGAAAARAGELVAAGADLLDIGGESTRPGAARVPAEEQIRRIVPAVRAIRAGGVEAPITVDTTLARVAEAALDAGADAINDVSGGSEDAGLLALAARRGCGVILMHRLTSPERDAYSHSYAAGPEYPGGVVAAVGRALAGMLRAAEGAGIPRERVLLDPGLGFGKTVEQNLELIREAGALQREAGRPLLGAVSRKSFVAIASGLGRESEPRSRLGGSIALAVELLGRGIRVFRAHDVAEHAQALRAAWALGEPCARGGTAATVRGFA